LGLRPASAAAVSVSAGFEIHAATDFYAPLTSYGAWVDVGNYGRCFHPSSVAVGWRPYTLGHWEYTDVGWYWVTDEPFGWACYHYGSWVEDPQYGWVWVPGLEWSPAWVVWRESDQYIGWAPCGPNLTVSSPSLFVFVDVRHFCDPIQPGRVIVNNTRIINSTRVVNNFRSETREFNGGQRRMRVNAGPDVARIQHATGRNFTPTPVRTAIERTEMKRSSEQRGGERSATTPEQRQHERSLKTPEQQRGQERSVTTPEQQTRERSATTPQKPAVQEPSGAERQRRQSTSTHEAPATAAPHESQRAPVEHAPAVQHESAPAQSQSHAAPPAQAHEHQAEQNRGNERDRRNENP